MTTVGYENLGQRLFCVHKPLRPLNEIEADISSLEGEIAGLRKGPVA